MQWVGKITKPMSAEIATAFELNRWRVRAVELKLDSGGGSVKEGEEVIRVLQNIKKLMCWLQQSRRGGVAAQCAFLSLLREISGSLEIGYEGTVVVFGSHQQRVLRGDRAKRCDDRLVDLSLEVLDLDTGRFQLHCDFH